MIRQVASPLFLSSERSSGGGYAARHTGAALASLAAGAALFFAGCATKPIRGPSYPPPGRYAPYSLRAFGDTGLHLWDELYLCDPLQDFRVSYTFPLTISTQLDFYHQPK